MALQLRELAELIINKLNHNIHIHPLPVIFLLLFRDIYYLVHNSENEGYIEIGYRDMHTYLHVNIYVHIPNKHVYVLILYFPFSINGIILE